MAAETKTTLSDETLAELQELIQINVDSRDGFNEAAEKTDDLTLAAMFQELALQRNDHVAELQTLVASNATEPENSGSMGAAMHRAWMDLRSAFGGGAAAILSEAERGEDYIKDKYEQALKQHPGAAEDALRRQYAAIKLAHDRVRQMRDEYKA